MNELPPAGYSLERLYFSELSSRLVPDEGLPESSEREVAFGWDWRILETQLFEILLQVILRPTLTRPEETFVSARGVFRVIGESTSVGVRDFVRLQGPAILMPYLREAVSSLTGRGPFGQHLLPAINVHDLMQGFKIEEATGARQLTEGEGQKLLAG